MDDGPGKAEELPLTGGEVVAVLPHFFIQSLVHAVNKAVGVYIPADLHHLFVRNSREVQKDIAADGAGEQEHILEHLTEVPPQRGNGDGADVPAVNENLTLLNVVVAADKGQNGGFARAGGADKGHGLMGLYMEGDTFQHPLARDVGEPYILELDFTPDFLQRLGTFVVHHLRHHVHDGEDLFRRGEGGLQNIKLLRHGLNGVKELGGVHIEAYHQAAGDHLPQKGGAFDVASAAEVEKGHHRGDIGHIHQGAEDAEDENPLMLGFGKGAAFLQKYLHFLLLPVENLGDFHAGEVLGQKGIDIGPGVRHLPVSPAGEAAEEHRIQKNKGYENQHHQGKTGVQQEHGYQHAYQHQHLLGHVHQHIGKHHGDGVGVVGDTGHQFACGNLVQLIVGQLLNVGKDAQPEAGENLLAGFLQDDGLKIGADHGDNQNPGVYHHPAEKLGHGKACLLHQFLDVANHVRGHEVIDEGHHGNDKCQQKGLPVGFGIGKQTFD